MAIRNCVALTIAICILAFCHFTVPAQSQTTGRIVGTVTDEKGAAIPGAEVTVTNKATGEERTVMANDSGGYIVPLLPAGTYTVDVTATGFKKFISDIQVAITETSTIDALLVVGAVTESVIVMAAPSTVQSDSSQLGRVVDSRTVAELPLATRNFTQILGLSTGTATYLPDNTAVGRNSQNISVNGGRVTNNNFQINGIDANSQGTNSAPSLSVPAPESIQEFKVQTSLYDATFGRSGGGNVQAVTKSGTNNFSGSVYEYFRNEKLNANNPFLKAVGVRRPVLKRNVFGGVIGGPIVPDRAFFFGSYQGTRERNGASVINSLSSNILITPGLTDNRSEAALLALFNSRRPAGSPALTAINPTALALLNTQLEGGGFLIPTPQTASGRFSGSTPSEFEEDQFNANIDYRFNDANTFAGKFFFSNAPQTLVLPSFLGGGPNVPGFGNFQQNNNRLLSFQYVRIFSPTIVNELRAGYNFIRVDATPQEPVLDSAIGITRTNANQFPGLPLIRIAPAAGGVVIGTSPTIDVLATAPSTTLADTLSITAGKHQIRTGAEFRYSENNYTLNFFTRGQIDFLSFDQFLQGNAFVSVFGSGIGDRSLRAPDYNFFVQDDYKVTPKLTLNLGLRYELNSPATDTRGRIATFDPTLYDPRQRVNTGSGFVQAGNATPEIDLASVPNVSDEVVRSKDPNNFAPRVGFAYSPLDSGRLVFRGGYGIFYSRTSFQYVTLNVIAPPTFVFGARVAGVGIDAGRSIPVANPFFPAPAQSQFPTFVPEAGNLSGTFFDRNIRTPYLQQYNASVQYELFSNYLVEAAYVGTHGINLFRQIGINQPPLASPQNPVVNQVTGAVITTNTPGNALLRAPIQGAGISNFFQNQSTAQSNYNSLQTSLTKRFSSGLSFLASYTFAKSIDNASGQGGGPGTGGVINPGAVGESSAILGNQFDNRANRGVSDFDRTHRFVLSGIYALPTPAFARDSAIGRVLLGGFQLGTIITAQSGLPIDIVDGGSASLYGLNVGTLARPSFAPGATVETARTNVPAGLFFNPAAFVRPVVGGGQIIPSSGGAAVADASCSSPITGLPTGACTDFGNVGRNILRGPRQTNVDFSIVKRFAIDERRNIEFRSEFFNLFNQVNFANPISDLNAGSASFGRIISTSNNPRLIQFGLKFNF